MNLLEHVIEECGYIKKIVVCFNENGGFYTLLLPLLWFLNIFLQCKSKHRSNSVSLSCCKSVCDIVLSTYIYLVLLEYDQPLLEERPTLQETIFCCD